jgi:hypothetical protein
MITTPLITRAEIQQYKQLSSSVNTAKLNELILQSQMVDLLPLLGERLYYDLLQNPEDRTALLDGSTYDYNGITYTNVGLKAVLSHYVYARYSMFGDVIDTAFGLKAKLNTDVSERIDTGMKKTLYEHNCNYAYNLWLNVELFLTRTKEPLYTICGSQQKNKNFKMSRIG